MTPIHKLISSFTKKSDKSKTPEIPSDRRKLLLELQKAIGVRFKSPLILNQSLMHRSYVHGKAADRHMSNERMEFLGDSVLGLVVNDYLYNRYPDRDEGDLTKIKSLVVSRQVLAKKATEIGLGKYLLLSAGEVESGGRKRSSIIADAMEAVIGAIYIDRGLEAAREFIRREILVGLHEITGAEEHTNYKSLLQELVQGSRKVHPVYRIQSEKGPDHDKQFIVDVSIAGRIYGRGTGKSKKEAEQSAAKSALERLAAGGAKLSTVGAPGGGAAAAGERAPREHRDGRDQRESREHRESREPREHREPREGREHRAARDAESREHREPREGRDRRDREGREHRGSAHAAQAAPARTPLADDDGHDATPGGNGRPRHRERREDRVRQVG
jgi:ribonuclease-3